MPTGTTTTAKRPARSDQSRSGSNKRQRTAAILVRLTPEERATVEAAANRAGLTLASYTRGQMIDGQRPRAARRPPVEAQQLGRILAELGKIGSNMNQLAKAANIGSFSVSDYEVLKEETRGLTAARAALMEALGRSA